MKIGSVTYVKSCLAPCEYPSGGYPEVAFVGRSNVGKSSLINALLNTQIARTSGTPGKTRAIHFYRVNDRFYFVDLPGYGFARAPKKIMSAWAPAIERYLGGRDELRGVVMLLDARHPPAEKDRQMKAWLEAIALPFLVVLTKMDKLNRGAQDAMLKCHRSELGLSARQRILPFSAKTRLGRDSLLRSIHDLLTKPAIM